MTTLSTHGCCSYIQRMKIELKAKILVRTIKLDNKTEFKNAVLNNLCTEKGISIKYSAPRTPQQNGVVGRKNRTLVEVARTMLNQSKLPIYFCVEVFNTACYTQNRTLINRDHDKTPYEIMANRKPTLKYFHVFGGQCFVLKDEHLGKFEPKVDEDIFIGYSLESKDYMVYLLDHQKIIERMNVIFHVTKLPSLQRETQFESLEF